MVRFYDTRLDETGCVRLVEEKQEPYEAERISHPEQAALVASRLLHMEELAEEHVYMLALDAACTLLGIFFLSKGTVNTALASPREIYIRALSAGAVQIILLHNHPSGNVLPSEADLRLTKKVDGAGTLLELPLVDHIIIGGKKAAYFSFREAGLLEQAGGSRNTEDKTEHKTA